jgi:site-specific DNA-methyltransferase (adenine-specific)
MVTEESMSPRPTILFYGDNLIILREHIPSESVILVYLDQPFNSDRDVQEVGEQS